MRSIGRRRSLRILSPDIGKATAETATQVTRIGLTFLGTSAFCLLSLLSPDSALLGGSERISVPFAGPVSFFGFMLLGPAVLIVLRIYLQIYVEHSERSPSDVTNQVLYQLSYVGLMPVAIRPTFETISTCD